MTHVNRLSSYVTNVTGSHDSTQIEETTGSEVLSVLALKKVTDDQNDNQCILDGYTVITKHGLYSDLKLLKKKESENIVVQLKIEEIIQLSKEIFEDKNIVERENLFASLQELFNELWQLRQYREAEFSKLITIIQTIIDKNIIDSSNELHINALVNIIQLLKIPKISSIDNKKCFNIIKEAKLDIYKPIRNTNNFKLIIQENK